MPYKTLDDLELSGRRVLIRVDLNLPVQDGRVTDATRVERSAPTIRAIVEKGGKAILLSHFGRPKGAPNPAMSLEQVRGAVADAVGAPVAFAPDCVGPAAAEAVAAMADGAVLLLENTRFHPGEEGNEAAFVDALAALGDAYVNDAFSAAHRAHASTEGLARRLPAAAGRAMAAELAALEAALGAPKRPVVAVVGGAKVSSKLALLGNLVGKVDAVVIGGGMANTFLAARGLEIGRSLHEADLIETAKSIEAEAAAADCAIVLPTDVVAADAFEAHAPHRTVPAEACPPDAMILDAGPQSVAAIAAWLEAAATVVWNGPLGAFELQPFDAATNAAALKAAALTEAGRLVSVAGGGDTVAALNASGAGARFTYVSTAGGAFLEWLEGKTLPGVAALEDAADL